MFRTITVACLIALYSLTITRPSQAADGPRWLDDQTIAVVRIATDEPTSNLALLDVLAKGAPGIANEINVWKQELTSICQAVKAAGGTELLVVYSMADAFTDQPLLVIPGGKEVDVKAFRSSFLGNGILNPFRQMPNFNASKIDDAIVLGTQATLDRINKSKGTPPAEHRSVLNRASQGNLLTMTLSPSRDQRRAASEMIPTLPASLGSGSVKELADEVAALQIDIAKSMDVTIKITGKPDAIVARLKTIQASLGKDEQTAQGIEGVLGKYLLNQIVTQAPKREGDSVSWTVPLAAALQSELGNALSQAIAKANVMAGMYSMRVLLLAIHNYESAYRKFPSVTTQNGEPRKLSWRVDLLPFMDELELYKEFHLDEPWDSEHNKKLIPRMPEVFRCPLSKHSAASGLSTIVLPVNDKAIWSKDVEVGFKDIEDGTSNTIMMIEASDDYAQVWTKPDPFEVDLSALEKKIGGHFEDGILIGVGDGSSSFLPTSQASNLPALITRSGGEVVDFR